jgi:hypothetical protein
VRRETLILETVRIDGVVGSSIEFVAGDAQRSRSLKSTGLETPGNRDRSAPAPDPAQSHR